jgi:Fe-S-cluster containining protein
MRRVQGLPADPDVPECLTCGACCFSRLATYVRVTGDDHARLGDHADELVWFDGNRAYLRMTNGHCSALRIETGSGLFVCSVYESRPQTCRDLARGSSACRGEIETKRDRPLLALAGRRSSRAT